MQGLHRVISTFKIFDQMLSVAFSLQAIHNAGEFTSFIMRSLSGLHGPYRSSCNPWIQDVRNGHTRRFDTMLACHNRNHLVLY